MHKTYLVTKMLTKVFGGRQASCAVNTVFEQIVRSVVINGKVVAYGFGTFTKVNGSAIQFTPGSIFRDLVSGKEKLPTERIALNALQRDDARNNFLTAKLFEEFGGYQQAVDAVNTVFEQIIRAVVIEGGFAAYGFGLFTKVNDSTVQFRPGHSFKDLVSGKKKLPDGTIMWNAPRGKFAAKKTAAKRTTGSSTAAKKTAAKRATMATKTAKKTAAKRTTTATKTAKKTAAKH
jgi:DNA-binding protein HU-beta